MESNFKVTGQSASSASPSDILHLAYNPPLEINMSNDVKISADMTFVKVFIDSTSTPPNYPTKMLSLLQGLEYEFHFYKDIVRPLLDYKVSPHFIRYYQMHTFDNISEYITFYHLNPDSALRNLEYMFYQVKMRPSITMSISDSPYLSQHISPPIGRDKLIYTLDNVRINCLELQAIDPTNRYHLKKY